MSDGDGQTQAPVTAGKRRWRPIIVTTLAVILLVAGGIAGFSWWRVHRTFQEINSVPALPSAVSASSLGADSTMEIDTGPAQAAIATAEAQRKLGDLSLLPTPTPQPITSSTITPSQPSPPAETPTATVAARSTAESLPPTSTPTDAATQPAPTPTATRSPSAPTATMAAITPTTTSSAMPTQPATLPAGVSTESTATPTPPATESAQVAAISSPTATTAAPDETPTPEPASPTPPPATETPLPSPTTVPITPTSGGTPVVTLTGVAQSPTPLPSPTAAPTGTPAPLPTATPEPPLTATATVTASIEPAPTLIATASPGASTVPAVTESPTVSPSASPEATSTQVLSSIERLSNVDFESGGDPWYLEAGAIVTTGMAHSGANALHFGPDGGYANQQFPVNTGTTYHASAWAIADQTGQTLQLGVVYYDADGNRRKDLEPERPIYSVTTEYQEYTYEFTPPAEVTFAQLSFYKVAAPGTMAIDDVSLRAVVPANLLIQPSTLVEDSAITILVMGVDARPGEPIDQGVRPDSLMVVRLNPDTGSCRVLAIPRDTRVELPGYGLTKVNHALAVGGIPYEQLVVEQYLGLAIDHYVLVDFTGFSELVDDVGGVDIDVPVAFTASDGTVFPAGPQHLNGDQALAYSRFRGDADGDFGRIQRQQQLIQALMKKAGDVSPVDAITELVPSLGDRLRTDLGQGDMLDLAREYGASCTSDSVEFLHLDGSIATFDDPLLNLPLSYVVVDEAELRRKVAELIGTS